MKREIQITTAEKKICMFMEIQNTEIQQEIHTEGNKIKPHLLFRKDIHDGNF
jgi:hypothetical protein